MNNLLEKKINLKEMAKISGGGSSSSCDTCTGGGSDCRRTITYDNGDSYSVTDYYLL